MFNVFDEALFQEILLPSSGNINCYVTYFLKKNMPTWTETVELADLGWKKFHNVTISSNKTVKLYGSKRDEFA